MMQRLKKAKKYALIILYVIIIHKIYLQTLYVNALLFFI